MRNEMGGGGGWRCGRVEGWGEVERGAGEDHEGAGWWEGLVSGAARRVAGMEER